MRYLAIILLLTGCATPPQWLADHYDSRDPCQTWNKPAGHVMPNWCGATRSTQYTVRDMQGRPIATIK